MLGRGLSGRLQRLGEMGYSRLTRQSSEGLTSQRKKSAATKALRTAPWLLRFSGLSRFEELRNAPMQPNDLPRRHLKSRHCSRLPEP